MFSTITSLSNLKQMVVNVSTSLTQSDTVQNVKEKVVSIPTQTKEYFYPSPEQYEMKSVVRLDDAFFVDKDIEEYITPGNNNNNANTNSNSKCLNLINNNPIKPSGNAIFITSWQNFELCVEDEALFDETEMGSYTTTNYSVTTGNTSILQSPHYNIKQSTLTKLNALEDEENNLNINLNLDEDNPEKLFENLHKFRKSFIAKRRASGVHDLDEQTAYSAPPTSKSDGSYHRRLHTLDLDQKDLDKMNLENSDEHTDDTINSDNSDDDDDDDDDDNDDEEEEKKTSEESVAPEHSNDNKPSTPTMTIQHAIEGSKEFGIDDIGIINDVTDETISSDDNNNNNNNNNNNPKHVKKISISKNKNNADEQVEFDLDLGDIDCDNDLKNADDVDEFIDSGDFVKLTDHWSVQRKLNGPRGSMKVTRISVSDELRETLMHQKSISQGIENTNVNTNINTNNISPTTSQSSFDGQHQSELGDYVKRVSLTPRGVDPDHAKVFVIDNEEKYDNSAEYLKSKNKSHKRTDSMDTQPDNNEQAPYISSKFIKQLNMDIKENKIDIISSSSSSSSSSSDDNNNNNNNNNKQQQSVLIRQESAQFYDKHIQDILPLKENKNKKDTEGWENPTGYDEKYEQQTNEDEDEDEDEDGYEETTNEYGYTTSGGYGYGYENEYMPYNEYDYLPQLLDTSYNERIIPRFNISESINNIIRFHCKGDALLSSDCIVIPITENWTPIHSSSHMLINCAGSEYLEYIYFNKKYGSKISTGSAQICENGYNLPCKYIINCVPPKYDDRYPVASENAINSCYWRSLELATDYQCKTIVLPSIYPPNFFSEQLAIHILARTLRRFLERYHEKIIFESIVICIDSELQMQLYTRIFTIYFPRDAIDLKYSNKYMPSYTGNNSGGTCVKLRTNNIQLSPLLFEEIRGPIIDYEKYDIYGNLRTSLKCMVECKEKPEILWKVQESKKWSWQKMEESFNIKYQRYWNRCRKSKDLYYMNLYQFVYVGGQDRDGRDIIIFVGNRFPAKELIEKKRLKQSLLYIIKELHHIVDRDYIIIYLHSFLNELENLPPISWINQCFQICSNRFSKNLYNFYVIHPTFRLKSWFYILSTKLFYKKIIYLDSITRLEQYNIDLEHIALPGKSWEYERELFGEDKLADKMALATDDLVLDALPYR